MIGTEGFNVLCGGERMDVGGLWGCCGGGHEGFLMEDVILLIM